MKKIKFLLLLGLFIYTNIWTQESVEVKMQDTQPPAPKQSKIYYGGNIGFSLGSYSVLAIRPLVGYKITPKLSAGLKLSYEYIWDHRYSTDYNTYNYGASIFARYRIIPQLYVHAEYAGYNYALYNALGESAREWGPFLFLGAGYSQPIGNNTWLNAQILFDVLQSEKSPYAEWSPFYSIGVGVGF